MANQQQLRVIQAAGIFVHTFVAGAIAFSEPLYARIPYHISIFTGESWVLELLNRHSEQMHTELEVCVPVFCQLVLELQEVGLGPSKHVSLEEQVAISLYASVMGLSIWHLGKCFQCSDETISNRAAEVRFGLVLCIFC
jgi:hypothetical protein